jgi:hypothetical protein
LKIEIKKNKPLKASCRVCQNTAVRMIEFGYSGQEKTVIRLCPEHFKSLGHLMKDELRPII